ncbi:hypothetical protein L7F22_053638 [Adiantum nelumboides]|nr:hypothetical protein [Adiantum nelumboides]
MWITRFVVVISFLALGMLISPDPFTAAFINNHHASDTSSYSPSVPLRLAYLLSFATAWGTSLWVTFIGGIIMFKHLPRHQFGNLQSRMFPAYFSLVAVCAAICTAGFSIIHPWKGSSSTEKNQLLSLVLSLTSTLANILVFEPLTIKTMRERHRVEREESIGDEVGLSKNKEVAKRNPKLAKLNKKFGMVHGLSSLANLLSFGGFAVHSWYLASKLLI